MKRIPLCVAALAALMLFTAACARCWTSADLDRADVAAGRLGKDIQASVYAGRVSPNLEGRALVEAAVADAPERMKALRPFQWDARVRQDATGRNWTVLLLCSPDGRRGLLERVACSGDKALWDHEGGTGPCEFSLDVNRACAR